MLADAVQMVRTNGKQPPRTLFRLTSVRALWPADQAAARLPHCSTSGGTADSCFQVTGHAEYGLPGTGPASANFSGHVAIRQQSQTILFESAAEMLDTFEMQQGGLNTDGWLKPSGESSEQPSSLEPTLSANLNRSFTRPVLAS